MSDFLLLLYKIVIFPYRSTMSILTAITMATWIFKNIEEIKEKIVNDIAMFIYMVIDKAKENQICQVYMNTPKPMKVLIGLLMWTLIFKWVGR